MKFNVSISRNSYNRVGIRVQCKTSRAQFLELDLSMEEYAEIITGLSHVEVEGSAKDLGVVGKTKVQENRTVCVAKALGSKGVEVISDWLLKNCQEDGWILNTYLGSQKSVNFDYTNNNYQVNYSVYKYVEV